MSTSTDLQWALDATKESAPFYARAEQVYDGTAPEKFASALFARLLKGSANRFRMNYARVPVTALCNRVKISSFGVQGDNEATDLLAQIWTANGMENLYREVHEKAASAGSAYLVAWPDPDSEDPADIDVSLADPLTTRVYYSPENPRKALFASRVWLQGKRVRVNLYYVDRIEKYISKAGTKGGTAATFEPYIDLVDEEGDGVWPIENPFGVIPIFHFHVGAGYGRPVNRDAWEPQDGINKLTATLMSTVDYQGFPQRYVLENATDIADEGSQDDWDTVLDPEATSANTPANQAGLKSGPGGVWFLNAKGAGQFEAADPDKFLKPMDQFVKAISTTTETPLHAFHGMGDAPSGESLRAANAPLNDNVRSFEGWMEPTWIDFWEFLLVANDLQETGQPKMVWANPEKADDEAFWKGVAAKITAGVPLYVALREAGYDEEALKQWGLLPPTSDLQDPTVVTDTTTSNLDGEIAALV
jgi:hypothetical protein